MKTTLFSNDYLECSQTGEGVRLKVKSKTYLKPGVLLTALGALSIPMSLLIAEAPNFKKLIFRILVWIVEYGLWYLGWVALVAGLFFLIRALPFVPAKKVLFDTRKRQLKLGQRSIPFSEVNNLRCIHYRLFGRTFVKIQFDQKGIRTPLSGPPFPVPDDGAEMQNFTQQLRQLLSD